jgi:hypothetical protein
MDRASHFREQADHARRLAEATWQDDLEEMLRRLARDFDEAAEGIEAGATEVPILDNGDASRRRNPAL